MKPQEVAELAFRIRRQLVMGEPDETLEADIERFWQRPRPTGSQRAGAHAQDHDEMPVPGNGAVLDPLETATPRSTNERAL